MSIGSPRSPSGDKEQLATPMSDHSSPKIDSHVPATPDSLTTPNNSLISPPNTSHSQYTFRPANPGDAGPISHLIGSTWAHFFAYSVTEDNLRDYLENKVSEWRIREEIMDDKKVFLVATLASSLTSSPSASTVQSMKGESESNEKDKVVGVAQLHLPNSTKTNLPFLNTPSSELIELNRFYLNSSQHGSGLATKLLGYAEDKARELGMSGMWLGAWEDNHRGLRFYQKNGFIIKGEYSFWVGDSKRRDLVMEKEL